MTTFAESFSNLETGVAPERILVATDLTDAEYLIPHIVAQAATSKAHVSLIHAILPQNSFPIESGAVPYANREFIDREARLALLDIARRIERQGISCDVETVHGFAADVIREKLHATGATRLIMGTHGRGKWGQFVLGSVANELLRTVDVPIFTVGPNSAAGAHAIPGNVLHPVSLLGDYATSSKIAIGLAKAYGARLTLLHVLGADTLQTVNPARTIAWAEHALEALVPATREPMPVVRVKVVTGGLVDQILNVATQTNADLIVLGVASEFPFFSFKETVAYKILASANCPVLTIRHGHPQKESQVAKGQEVEQVLG